MRPLTIHTPVDATRKPPLRACAGAIARRLIRYGHAGVVAICTHNSRRSQFAEVWLSVALLEAGVDGVAVASAGTETAAIAPGVLRALAADGFDVSGDDAMGNAPVQVRGRGIERPLWSKSIEKAVAAVRGPSNVVGLMVCAAADANCPSAAGVGFQARLPYVDPKLSDGSVGERAAYAKTSKRVEAEMRWLVRAVQEALADDRGAVPRV